MDIDLARYIADYINEELDRDEYLFITTTIILRAVEAYEGGAR